MLNLHVIANRAISVAHPNETVELYQAQGQTNMRGRLIPSYLRVQNVTAQVQTLGTAELAWAEQTSQSKIDRKAYLYAPQGLPVPQGVNRSLARTGDMIRRVAGIGADGALVQTWWLVTSLLEDFSASGWVCVGLVQQTDGIDFDTAKIVELGGG